MFLFSSSYDYNASFKFKECAKFLGDRTVQIGMHWLFNLLTITALCIELKTAALERKKYFLSKHSTEVNFLLSARYEWIVTRIFES